MNKFINSATDQPIIDSLLILAISAAVAWVVKFIFEIVIKRALKKTKTELDDEMVRALKTPIFWTVFIGGSYLFIASLTLNENFTKLITNFLITTAIFLWGVAVVKISRLLLKAYDRKHTGGRLSDAIPFLDNLILFVIFGTAALLVLDIWGINITPLVASAGVAGIAVAFAAKDTVSNLFGGISVFFDRPYKVGDYIIIEDKHRGEVIEIGMRSTKIRTRDSILITVPNSVMVTNAVVNETGFDPKLRIRIPMGVAYNSDLDKVEYALIEVMKSHKEVIKEPAPRIRYRRFGDSAIELEALCVIHKPANRGRVMHELIKEIDKAFKEEKISMPFPQRDVHLYEK